MDTILKTKNLCKYYGSGENEVKALQDVNIEIGVENLLQLWENPVREKVRCCTCWEAWTIPQTERYTSERKTLQLSC